MLVPAIHFPNTCAEAHKLYKKAFDMTVNRITYYSDVSADYHDEPLTDETWNLIMHSECTICGIRINMSDTGGTIKTDGMIHFNIFLSSEDDVLKAFNVLKEGGVVESEPQPVFWSSLHCSLKDRFGISWQIMTE